MSVPVSRVITGRIRNYAFGGKSELLLLRLGEGLKW